MPYSFNDSNWSNIPSELANLKRWIAWKYIDKEYPDGVIRTTKVPISVVTHKNFRRDTNECVSLNELKLIYKTYKYDDFWAGIGFSSHGDENILVLDFDDCLNENNEFKSQDLKDLIYSLRSYTEISPSGKGIRVFTCLETDKKIFYSFQVISKRGVELCNKFGCKGIELWNKNKFATVTGNFLDKNLDKIVKNDLVVNDFIVSAENTFNDFIESIKHLPRRKINKKNQIKDCDDFEDEENYFDNEEEFYSCYNEDEYEDPFTYVNSKSLINGSYEDNTPLT
jgi:primase-polymerase (primpol)-like protein